MKRGVSALFERPPRRAVNQNCFCDHSHSLSSRGIHSISARDIFPQICPFQLLLRVKKSPHHSQLSKREYHLWFYPFLSINIRPVMNQLLPCSMSHVLSSLSPFCTVTEVHGFIQLLPGYLTTPLVQPQILCEPLSAPRQLLLRLPLHLTHHRPLLLDLCTLLSLLGIPFA